MGCGTELIPSGGQSASLVGSISYSMLEYQHEEFNTEKLILTADKESLTVIENCDFFVQKGGQYILIASIDGFCSSGQTKLAYYHVTTINSILTETIIDNTRRDISYYEDWKHDTLYSPIITIAENGMKIRFKGGFINGSGGDDPTIQGNVYLFKIN